MESEAQDNSSQYMARCLKCKTTGQLTNPVVSTSKNNRTRVAGTCAGCNGNVSTFAKGSGSSSGKGKK